MQARRASRELALIIFSQIGKDIEKYANSDFEQMVLGSVRTLISNSMDEISIVTSELSEVREFVEEFENNHPDNLARPIDAHNIAVEMPLTSNMKEDIDVIMNAAEKSVSALEIAELSVLSGQSDVKRYIHKIIKTYKERKDDIDGVIKELASGWDIDRLFKIDKDILRISITELLFIKDAPVKVVIDEALELAKKYSTDDSPSFINGILAKVVESYV